MPSQFDQNHLYYQSYFQFQGRGKWMEKIWSEAFGENYPKGIDHFGYVTQEDLKSISSRLTMPSGSALLDIGCGKGGPGLKIAESLDLALTGIDIIPEAIEHANSFKNEFNLSHDSNFLVGEFYEIPLEDQSVDGVISIDALWAVTDKLKALQEIKRVMKPGAQFIFSQWDLLAEEPIPVLEQSGLTFISREDTPNWKTYQQKVYDGILKHRFELMEEMGPGANMLLYEAGTAPPYLDLSVRRIYEMKFE